MENSSLIKTDLKDLSLFPPSARVCFAEEFSIKQTIILSEETPNLQLDHTACLRVLSNAEEAEGWEERSWGPGSRRAGHLFILGLLFVCSFLPAVSTWICDPVTFYGRRPFWRWWSKSIYMIYLAHKKIP